MEADTVKADRITLQIADARQVEALLKVLASTLLRILEGDGQACQRHQDP